MNLSGSYSSTPGYYLSFVMRLTRVPILSLLYSNYNYVVLVPYCGVIVSKLV